MTSVFILKNVQVQLPTSRSGQPGLCRAVCKASGSGPPWPSPSTGPECRPIRSTLHPHRRRAGEYDAGNPCVTFFNLKLEDMVPYRYSAGKALFFDQVTWLDSQQEQSTTYRTELLFS
jgi:hypothetical protein